MAHNAVPPVFLVTGFLGSGKTLFLQSLLSSTVAGPHNAVIVNDFGEAVYDDFLLRAHATTFIELPGGCLCCSALDDFKQALTDVSERAPARILVETTGLADAASVRDDLQFMGFPVDAVLCIVDALHWQQHHEQFALFAEQIREADYVLISKKDRANPADLPALEQYLHTLNSRAPLLYMNKGHVHADALSAMLAPAAHIAPRNRAQLPLVDSPIAVFNIALPPVVQRRDLECSLAMLPRAAIRLKGRVVLQDEHEEITFFLLNFVNGRWSLLEIPQNAQHTRQSSALALIGLELADSDVTAAFAAIPGARVQHGELHFHLPEQPNS